MFAIRLNLACLKSLADGLLCKFSARYSINNLQMKYIMDRTNFSKFFFLVEKYIFVFIIILISVLHMKLAFCNYYVITDENKHLLHKQCSSIFSSLDIKNPSFFCSFFQFCILALLYSANFRNSGSSISKKYIFSFLPTAVQNISERHLSNNTL